MGFRHVLYDVTHTVSKTCHMCVQYVEAQETHASPTDSAVKELFAKATDVHMVRSCQDP
jgi:hypothetical protein